MMGQSRQFCDPNSTSGKLIAINRQMAQLAEARRNILFAARVKEKMLEEEEVA